MAHNRHKEKSAAELLQDLIWVNAVQVYFLKVIAENGVSLMANIAEVQAAVTAIEGDTANVARVNLLSLASLANAPARPKNVTIVTRVSNDTELKWDANTDTDLAGYEIVWRETAVPEWTNFVFVGNVGNVK